jgi:hypothetical protein
VTTPAAIAADPGAPPPPAPDPAIGRATRFVALAGGIISVATALLVTSSVTLRWLGYGAINGDFELVQVGVALSVFCFLPLTQASRGNIVVDTFTGWLPARACRLVCRCWSWAPPATPTSPAGDPSSPI